MTKKLKLQYIVMFVAFAILAAMTWFALEPPRNPWFLATIGAGLLFGIVTTIYRARKGHFND